MEILATVLPIFLVMGLGYFLRSAGFIDARTNGALSRLVFYVAAPALLYRGTSRAPLSETVNGATLAVTIVTTLLVMAAVYLGCQRAAPARRGVLAQGAFRSNMVFVGLPVVAYACGEEALGSVAVLIGVMVIVYNFVSVLILVLPHGKGNGTARDALTRTLLEILRNPLIIGCALGILASGLEVAAPLAIDRAIELVGRIAMPLALLSVGASLDLGMLRAELGAALWVAVIKLIAYPAIVYVALCWLGVTGADLAGPTLVMGAPTAVVSSIMAREMKGDEQLAAAIVIGTTLASLATLSCWVAVLLG